METISLKRGDRCILKKNLDGVDGIFRKGTEVLVTKVDPEWKILEIIRLKEMRDEIHALHLEIYLDNTEEVLEPPNGS